MSDELVPQSKSPRQVVRDWDSYIAQLPNEIDQTVATQQAGVVAESMRRYDTGSMVAKFCLGTIAYLANPDWRNTRKYGESIIETIADQHGINANVLREARRCSEFFGLDLQTYYDWLTEEDDYVKTWTDVRKIIRAWDDPEVLGPDALADRLARRIESAGEDLQKLRERAHEGDISDEEYDGVKQNFLDDVDSFDQDKDEALQEQKIETPRSEEYKSFIKRQDCVATGSPPPNAPHHVAQGGGSIKGSDFTMIPLADKVHQYLEDTGHRAAEKKYNFSIAQAMFEMYHLYHHGYIPSLPPDISFRRHGTKGPTPHDGAKA